MGKVGGPRQATKATDLGTWFRLKQTALFEDGRKDPYKEGENYCAIARILSILLMNG